MGSKLSKTNINLYYFIIKNITHALNTIVHKNKMVTFISNKNIEHITNEIAQSEITKGKEIKKKRVTIKRKR